MTLLQLSSHTQQFDETAPVPLPARQSLRSHHEIALAIRDGRITAKKLASLGDASKTTGSTEDTSSNISEADQTSMSTALEQDFTIEGKKGDLGCPFQRADAENDTAHKNRIISDAEKQAPHHSADPICAAMYEDSASQSAGPNGNAASRCPIRFIDQHSPEEVAHYVETHKHELPRSHEVCLRRYQHNEQQIRKLDSKYGNVVSMIEGLTQLHKPLMPEDQNPADDNAAHLGSEANHTSSERVQNWAKDVSATTDPESHQVPAGAANGERQSQFDRPLKEIRVGESPTRPWGISVPIYEEADNEAEHPFSPPPAPVRMPSPSRNAQTPSRPSRAKCPFDHTKLAGLGHTAAHPNQPPIGVSMPPTPASPESLQVHLTPRKETMPPTPTPQQQPTFLDPDTLKGSGGTPQMVFTGPVFIGYPMDQAIQFMNQYKPAQ